MTSGRAAERYVALIRAINVPGHQTLNMQDVRATFAVAGCANVRTCVQSGNIVFDYPRASPVAISQNIRTVFAKRLGADTEVLLRTGREMERLVRRNPFNDIAVAGPRVKLYVAFLFRRPRVSPPMPIVSSTERLTAVAIRDREVFMVGSSRAGFLVFPTTLSSLPSVCRRPRGTGRQC